VKQSTPLSLLLLCTLLLSCKKHNEFNAVAWPYGVKYEIFVMSFADGDGNGKGDFKGLTAKLDYLKELGINGIWLMPIMPSDTYHKYHVIDYKNIDPDYGSLADFKIFIDEAHKRNIRVITDFVINHTGNLHPWFVDAQKGEKSSYRDYYVWANKDSIRNEIFKKTTSFDSDNIRKWHPVKGDTLSEHYYGYFNGLCPDLNLDNPKVKEEIIDIATFWLNEVKVDGFRMDAARHIFMDERATDNHEFWVWFRKEMENIKPDVYLVGEVWSDAKTVAPYLKGLPSLFNFEIGYAITSVASAGIDTIGLVKKYKDISDYYKSITTEYLDATFIKNHDQTRLLTELKGDQNKARMAASLLLTLPGTPYIYYGEEIGMLGDKLKTYEDFFGPDAYVREPFVWDLGKKDPMQTSWETPEFSTDKSVIPQQVQENDPSSLLNFYRKLIHYRNSSMPLTQGDIDYSGIEVSEVVSFRRIFEEEQELVIHNVSDVEVTVTLDGNNDNFNSIEYFSSDKFTFKDNELRLPAFTTVILK
jgi:alpha-amylase